MDFEVLIRSLLLPIILLPSILLNDYAARVVGDGDGDGGGDNNGGGDDIWSSRR